MTRLTRSLLSLRRLLPGQGRADAPRVWLALWSHVRWRRKRGETWIGDRLLAEETGLDVSVAEDPLTAVARGTAILIERLDEYESILSEE